MYNNPARHRIFNSLHVMGPTFTAAGSVDCISVDSFRPQLLRTPDLYVRKSVRLHTPGSSTLTKGALLQLISLFFLLISYMRIPVNITFDPYLKINAGSKVMSISCRKKTCHKNMFQKNNIHNDYHETKQNFISVK